MLHITLTVLKMIGVILLVMILLVIGILLAILFVPLRYRLQVVYTSQDIHGEVRITWLLHLISLRLCLQDPPVPESRKGNAQSDSEEEKLFFRLTDIHSFYEVRILGINLDSILTFFKRIRSDKEKRQKKKAVAKRNARATSGARSKGSGDGKRQESRNRPGNQTKNAGNETGRKKQTTVGEPQKRRKEGAEGAWTETIRHAETENAWEDIVENTQAEKSRHNEDNSGGFSQKCRNLLDKWIWFCERIKQIPSRLSRFCRLVKEMLEKPGQMAERLSAFQRKLEKYQAAEVISEVWNEIRRLLCHYRVRKGTGYLHFGTSDPALTGEITGVLYLILPASCGEIAIEPEFTETTFETDLQVRGHIRMIHLVQAAWWTFRNKKLRRLIRAFQK